MRLDLHPRFGPTALNVLREMQRWKETPTDDAAYEYWLCVTSVGVAAVFWKLKVAYLMPRTVPQWSIDDDNLAHLSDAELRRMHDEYNDPANVARRHDCRNRVREYLGPFWAPEFLCAPDEINEFGHAAFIALYGMENYLFNLLVWVVW